MGPKRTMLVLLVALLLISGAATYLVPAARADAGDSGGRGVILIHDVYELQNMSLDLNGSYELANDIDASVTRDWNGGAGFTPIGNPWPVGDEAIPFNGSFDGAGHVISGLYLSHNHNYIGMFSMGTESSLISNVTLKNLYISANNIVGGLIGETSGDLRNCHVNGSITAYNDIGGVSAILHNGTMDNCTFDGWLRERNSSSGGLVAINDKGTISNCSSNGSSRSCQNGGGLIGENSGIVTDCHANWTISGGSLTGGLICRNHGRVVRCFGSGSVSGATAGGLIGANGGTVSECFFCGDVEARDAGGLVGENSGGQITDCFTMGKVRSGGSYAGGLVGRNLGELTNCYSTAVVSGSGNTGGLVGEGTYIPTRCFWDLEASGISNSSGGTGLNTSDMMEKASFYGWDFTTIWDISEGHSYPYLRTFNTTAPAMNHPPVILIDAVTTVMEDSLYEVRYAAGDADNDSLAWSLSTVAAWLSINTSSGMLSGLPSGEDIGRYGVRVTVSDGKGGFDSQFFSLTVKPLSGEPSWIDAPDDSNLTEGDNYTFQ